MSWDHVIPKVPEGHVVDHVSLSRVSSQGHMPLFPAWLLDYNWALGRALLDLCACLLVYAMARASPATDPWERALGSAIAGACHLAMQAQKISLQEALRRLPLCQVLEEGTGPWDQTTMLNPPLVVDMLL